MLVPSPPSLEPNLPGLHLLPKVVRIDTELLAAGVANGLSWVALAAFVETPDVVLVDCSMDRPCLILKGNFTVTPVVCVAEPKAATSRTKVGFTAQFYSD